ADTDHPAVGIEVKHSVALVTPCGIGPRHPLDLRDDVVVASGWAALILVWLGGFLRIHWLGGIVGRAGRVIPGHAEAVLGAREGEQQRDQVGDAHDGLLASGGAAAPRKHTRSGGCTSAFVSVTARGCRPRRGGSRTGRGAPRACPRTPSHRGSAGRR